MITKKAAIGFILLAIITFTVATMDYNGLAIMPVQTQPNVTMDGIISTSLQQSSAAQAHEIKPILNFGSNTPLIITAVLEAFAFVCYIILKWLEPKINKAILDDAIRRKKLQESKSEGPE
jgi:hypothetical protein